MGTVPGLRSNFDDVKPLRWGAQHLAYSDQQARGLLFWSAAPRL